MQNDLISRSALLRDPYFQEDRYPESHLLRMAIKEAHAVDAEKVVRCKDCKHCIHLSRRYRGDIACSKLHTDNIYPDFYCGCGERRGDDGK